MAGAVRNNLAIQVQGLGGSIRVLELDEAVASVAGVLVTNDLDVDSLGGRGEEDTLDKILIHPGFKLAHPTKLSVGLHHWEEVLHTKE